MYTAPTALISLVVLLPVLAGLAALYYSHVNMVLASEAGSESERAARIAALAVAGEIRSNSSLQARIANASLTEADLEYLSRVASGTVRSVTGIPYRVDIYILVANRTVEPGTAGFDPVQGIVGAWKYTPKEMPQAWHYETVRIGGGLVVVVGAGV